MATNIYCVLTIALNVWHVLAHPNPMATLRGRYTGVERERLPKLMTSELLFPITQENDTPTPAVGS